MNLSAECPECPLIEQRLPRLQEDDLPVGERALVLAHVRGCASCAAAHARFVAVRDAVRDARSDGGDFEHLRARVAAAIDARPAAFRMTPRGALAAAALIALAVGSLFVLPNAIEHANVSGAFDGVRAAMPTFSVDLPIPTLSDLGAVR